MSTMTPLQKAIQEIGLARLARELNVSYQAVRKWEQKGRMPRTEWTGETAYCARIAELTDGVVSREQLLARWPAAAETAPEGSAV